MESLFVNEEIDLRLGLQWSPEGNRLAFWTIGQVGEGSDSDPRNLRSLVFFDADTTQFTVADTSYLVNTNRIGPLGQWSPTGNHFAFIDEAATLMYVDAATGSSWVLDDHVDRIVSWENEG